MISRWCTLLIFIGLFSGMVAASGEISVVNNIRMGERDGNVVTGATYPQYLFGGYEYLPRIGGTGVAYSGNVRVQRSTVSLDFSNAGYSSHRPIITQTDNWGIEAWLQSDNGSLTSVIAYNGNSASSGMGLYQHQGKYVGLVGGKVFVGGVPVSANWTHLAIVAQNGVTTFYVNGVANATGPLPELPAGRFNIGNRPDLLEQFDGRIDEVRAFTFAAGNFSVADLQTTAVAAEQIAPKLPFGVPLANRQGTLTVDFPSAPPGAGWRFAGEKEWRSTGGSATGLQTELLPSRLDRILEFRPVAGYQHPSQEMINIARGEGPLVLTRNYIAGAPAATGAVSVLLHPSSIALPALPPAARAQWRLLGENDSHWQESGGTLPNLAPGSYLIECKPIDARTAPPPIAVTVLENTTTTVAATYSLPASQTGTAPMPVSFETVNTSPSLPCQYVGQLRSDTSAGTGFVVRSQVVATAGDVVFDDATLSAVTGLQWLFQRDPGNYEPEPSIPRGFYLMAGYAAQKAQDNSPGTNSPEARNLDMAALYFQGFAGRSGYNGSLASGSTANEWILSGALKTLVSYPFAEIPLVNRSRMHMTLPANVTFTQTAAHTYTTPDLRGNRGSEGGPLCVQVGAGYYPVAILLGGIGQTVVREIDTAAVQLFDYLQDQSEFDGKPDAGFTISNSPLSGASSASASLKVILTPSVPANSARWKLGSGGTAFTSGSQQNGLVPGIYYIYFTDIPGFLPPHTGSQDAGLIVLPAGTLTTVTATYKGITTQPINRVALPGGSATFSIGVSGAPSAFQWKLNGANIPGATSAAYTRSNITAASAGAYSVEVTWTTGTMTSSAASLQLKQTIT
ncbi:MAG: LamG domain-containing protein, partial [Verrucomicrobiota bacterium]